MPSWNKINILKIYTDSVGVDSSFFGQFIENSTIFFNNSKSTGILITNVLKKKNNTNPLLIENDYVLTIYSKNHKKIKISVFFEINLKKYRFSNCFSIPPPLI